MESTCERIEGAAPGESAAEGQLLRPWIIRLIEFWGWPVLCSGPARLGLLAAVAGICLARAYIGLYGTQLYSHDAFPLLDGAWRILNGQRPHADFFTALGPLSYFPTVAGLILSGGRAGGFGFGQALVGFIAGLWTYLITRQRLSDVPAVLACLAGVLIATAPFSLDRYPFVMTPDTTYNRYGYALVSIILIELFSKRKDGSGRGEFMGGVSTGAILVLLLFLKVSFFGGAALAVLCLLWCRAQTRSRFWGLAAGFFAVSLLFLIYLRFDLAPMARDLSIAALAKHVNPRWYSVDKVFEHALALMVFAAAASGLIAGARRRSARSMIIAAAVIVVLGVFFLFTSFEGAGFPLACILVILIIDRLNPRLEEIPDSRRFAYAVVLGWGAVFIISSLASSGMGLTAALAQRVWIAGPHWQSRHHERLNSPILNGFIPVADDESYLSFVNDGLALVNRYRQPWDTVMSLDFSNPFLYGLGIKPARGGATVLQYNVNFDETHKPAPEWVMGNYSLLMVPVSGSENARTWRAYRQFVESHFHQIGLSKEWRIYRAKGPRTS